MFTSDPLLIRPPVRADLESIRGLVGSHSETRGFGGLALASDDELSAELRDGFVARISTDEDVVVGVLRLLHRDQRSRTGQIACIYSQAADRLDRIRITASLLGAVFARWDLRKVYVESIDPADVEVLGGAGFEVEANLKERVFEAGSYVDLQIFAAYPPIRVP